MNIFCSTCTLIGRIGLALIFLFAGISKFTGWESATSYMEAKGFTFIPFFLICAALIEILGSVLLITGYKARWTAAVLFLYLIPTTLIFHSFWTSEVGGERLLQTLFFLKNLAIMGGLLYIIGCGAGSFSLDRCCKSSREDKR